LNDFASGFGKKIRLQFLNQASRLEDGLHPLLQQQRSGGDLSSHLGFWIPLAAQSMIGH